LWALIPVALWATYTAGVGTVKVLRAIHALAWRQQVPKLRRGWLAATASFGFSVVLVGLVAASQTLRERSEGAGIGFVVAEVAIFVALWWGASRALPHDPGAGWLALLPGAVLVGLGAWGLHVVSVYYLARRVASASELYGSLGVAAAILVWLYLIGRLVVAAAMLNATLWERRSGGVTGVTEPE
jgi:membrane protein